MYDSLEAMKVLIAAGADVNAKDKYGITTLMHVAENGLLDEVKLLIDAGADVNAKDEWGQTALMHTGIGDYGTAEVIRELIAAGADVNAKTNNGYTALDLTVFEPLREALKNAQNIKSE